MGSSTPISSAPPRGSGRSKGSAAQPHLARLPCGKGAGRRKAVSPRQGTKDSARCAAELICGGAAPLFCRKAALTYFCGQRPRFFLPQGEASSAPPFSFPPGKENGPPGGPREKRPGDLRPSATEEGWMCPLDPALLGGGAPRKPGQPLSIPLWVRCQGVRGRPRPSF